MKWMLILLLVLFGVLLWRNRQSTDHPHKKNSGLADLEPMNMVRCALCAMHIPAIEAIQGKNGAYCCADHRHHAEP